MINKLVVLILVALLVIFVKGISGEYVELVNSMSLIFVSTGTLLCVFLSLGLKGIKHTFKLAFRKIETQNQLILKMVEYSELIYQNSETTQNKIISEYDPYIKDGMIKVYEGILSPDEIASTMKKKSEINYINSEKMSQNVRNLIKYPTIFGLLGTLLALVAYLNHQNELHLFLGSPPEIIEFGLLSSIYGFVFSYFLILPYAEKIERVSEKTLMNQKIIQEAFTKMVKRTNPVVVKEILTGYLEDYSHQGSDKYEYDKV